jgi:hypothetical protein
MPPTNPWPLSVSGQQHLMKEKPMRRPIKTDVERLSAAIFPDLVSAEEKAKLSKVEIVQLEKGGAKLLDDATRGALSRLGGRAV